MMNLVYTITLPDARKEYANNSGFRDIIQSGCFVYAEGSYILDKPEYISRNQDNIPELTEYARQNLGECALAFDDTVIYKYSGSATRGDFKSLMTVEKKHSVSYKPASQKKELTDEIIKRRELAKQDFEYQRAQSKNCWERIYEILQEKRATADSFHLTTRLHPDYYSRAKKGRNSPPELRTIIAIAAGYNLGIHRAEELLNLAGHAFISTSEEHDAFRFILNSMYDCDMDTKNELLMQEGFEPLGTKPREKNPVYG